MPFFSPTDQDDNLSTESEENGFDCDKCYMFFTSQTELSHHMTLEHSSLNSHKDNNSFRCDICDKKYQSKKGLTYHMVTKHGGGLKSIDNSFVENELICGACNVNFSTLTQLKSHMSQVHNEKIEEMSKEEEFNCKLCLSSFNSYSKLREHIQNGVCYKPAAPVRNTDFTQKKSALLKNNVVLTKLIKPTVVSVEKPKKPKMGPKSMMMSPPKKPKMGPKSMMVSPTKMGPKSKIIKVQMRSQSKPILARQNDEFDEIPVQEDIPIEDDDYNCDICDEFFPNASEFRKHMKQEHPDENSMYSKSPKKIVSENVHNCETCGKKCATASGLKMHILSKHEKKENYMMGPSSKTAGILNKGLLPSLPPPTIEAIEAVKKGQTPIVESKKFYDIILGKRSMLFKVYSNQF